MKNSNQESRRTFMKKSSGTMVAMTAPMVISQHVFGANEKINMGIVGPGRRGGQVMGDFMRTNECQFIAVCDLNQQRLDWVARRGNLKKYTDFNEMFENKEIDAIVNATPDHWHAHITIQANISGKDVYVEKPMTLTIEEGQKMVEAARKYECIVQCGSQQRSDRNSRIGCELVRNKAVGKIHNAHGANYPSPWEQPMPQEPVPEGIDWDKWIGPAKVRPYHRDIYTPRAKPGWISFTEFSGGEVTGWGAHGVDMIQWALGTELTGPTKIWTEGNPRMLDRIVHMEYKDGTKLSFDGKSPEGGGMFEGEDGSIVVDRGRYTVNPKELEAKAEIKDKLPVSNAHAQNFLDCVRSRELPIADVEIAHRSTTICHLINIARWTYRELEWDPDTEMFVDDDDANTFISRPRRAPYELPTI